MAETDDLHLLREYVAQRSEQAFAELVRRHVNLVYSTAFRLIGERQLAEDVAQVVFIKLASKAGSIREGIILSGWLYRTTQFVAETARRSDYRRRKRDEVAMQNRELEAEGESVWKEVAPFLEQAMGRLARPDQDAVLLRFFEGRSLREVGEALGITDDAAQKRVNRALAKMRDYFAENGIAASSAAIPSILAAHAVQAAPAALASNLVAVSLGGGATAGSVAAGLLKIMAVAKIKALATGGVAALLLLAGGVILVNKVMTQANPVAAANTPPAPALLLEGIARRPDGRPLAGALVQLATPQAYARVYQTSNSTIGTATNSASGKAVPGSRAVTPGLSNQARTPQSVTTGLDGAFRFELPTAPQDVKMAVLVTADDGYALVTGEELMGNRDVLVEPWGRIEGVLRIGKTRAANQTIKIGIWGSDALYEWSLVSHAVSAKTDEQGRFVFARVAPGDFWLTRQVEVRPNDWRQNGHHFVHVNAGETLQVQMGGMGRPLIGRVVWDSPEKLRFYGSMWAQNHPMRTPRDWRNWSIEERRKFEHQWRQSPEGERFKHEVRNYEFPVEPDGTFRVEDVLPGIYQLQVRADGPEPGTKKMRHVAAAEMHVEVAEIPNGRTDELFDVGTLDAKAVASP